MSPHVSFEIIQSLRVIRAALDDTGESSDLRSLCCLPVLLGPAVAHDVFPGRRCKVIFRVGAIEVPRNSVQVASNHEH